MGRQIGKLTIPIHGYEIEWHPKLDQPANKMKQNSKTFIWIQFREGLLSHLKPQSFPWKGNLDANRDVQSVSIKRT